MDNIVKNKVESPNNLVNFLNWLITKSISESNYSYVPNSILDEWRYDREYLKVMNCIKYRKNGQPRKNSVERITAKHRSPFLYSERSRQCKY